MKIPEATPSLNKYAFSHWRVQYRDKQRWEMLLLVASREVGATKATGKRCVKIERHGRRMLDVDNLYGGVKPVLDGMRKLHLILDDDHTMLELRCENVPLLKGEKPYTCIIVEDAS